MVSCFDHVRGGKKADAERRRERRRRRRRLPLDERFLAVLLLVAAIPTDGQAADRIDEGGNDLGILMHLLGSTGLALLREGKASDAERAFQAVVRLDPAGWTGRFALGTVHMEQCHFAHAAAHFSEAASVLEETHPFRQYDHTNVTAQHGLALLSLAKLTDDEEMREASIRDAIRIISNTVRNSPGSSIALLLGDRFSKLEGSSPGQAISVLNYPLGGACSDISVERGRGALERGDASRAVRYADAARRLDAENAKAMDLMREALREETRAAAEGSSWPAPVLGNEVFFSQVGQDEWLWRHVFRQGIEGRKGVFVEAGAVDGVVNSNTLFFERSLGWEGLLVEPNPSHYRLIAGNRPGSTGINVAGGGPSSRGTMPFLVGFGQNSICSQRGGLATGMTNKEVSKLYKDCKRVESVDVEVVPFGELMLRHGIEHVDALFIDMEGYELAALESIDFSRISVTALCVENNEDPRDAGKVRRLLEPLGYRLAATLAQDDIYVSSKVAVS